MIFRRGCPACGNELRRTKRSFGERLHSSGVYLCGSCGHRATVSRLSVWSITRHARCPECHGERLRVLKWRDYIDRYNRNPFRLLCSLFKAPLYHCSSCRLQFYDPRRLATQPARKTVSEPERSSDLNKEQTTKVHRQ